MPLHCWRITTSLNEKKYWPQAMQTFYVLCTLLTDKDLQQY